MPDIVIWKPGDEMPPLKILDWITDDLAVGSIDQADAANVLELEGVKAIVSIGELAPTTKLFHRHFPRIKDDGSFMQLTDGEVGQVLDAIREALTHGRVLLHCAAGVSRSAGFAALHLSLSEGVDFFEAMLRVKEKRDKASPASHVISRLSEYGRTHRSFAKPV